MGTFRRTQAATAWAIAATLSIGLGGCWFDSSEDPTPATSFRVGGTIAGLTSAGLVLGNGNDSVSPTASATSFVVSTAVAVNTSYNVRVVTQPANATCTVASATGTVTNADIGNVLVTCTTQSFAVGGSISGLTADGLVLSNGTDSVSPASGASIFSLPAPVASGATYAVTVRTQPAGETCTVANGSGSVGALAITNVAVTCATNAYTIGGVIAGLTGTGLVLSNGSDRLNVASGALAFTFPTAVARGGSYAVSVFTQPTGSNCSVSNGTGTVGASPVANVQVTCGPRAFTVGGSIGGLTGSGLVLANGGDTVAPQAGATSFVFPTPVASGGSYSVTVQTQPSGQTCTVAGTFPASIGSANVTNVLVSCTTTSTYTLVAGQETCPAQPIVDGTGAAASLNPQVNGAVLDSAGNYYAFDGGRVRKVTPAGVVTTIAGGPPGNGTIVDGTGAAAVFAGRVFGTPAGMAVDGSGNIFVADLYAIRKVTPAGVVTTIAGASTSGSVDGVGTIARFNVLSGLAFDPAGNLIVLDGPNSALRRIDAAGAVTTLSKTGAGFIAGILGTSSQLFVSSQSGLVVDAAGNMYIAGPFYTQISKITPLGVVSVLAGSQTTGFADGVGAAAMFAGPYNFMRFSSDAAGNIYVTDNTGTAFRRITPAGAVTTLAVASNFSNVGTGVPPPQGAVVLAPLTSLYQSIATPAGSPYVYVGCSLQKTGP